MARVYVSSTFSDLRDCREQVRLTQESARSRADHPSGRSWPAAG